MGPQERGEMSKWVPANLPYVKHVREADDEALQGLQQPFLYSPLGVHHSDKQTPNFMDALCKRLCIHNSTGHPAPLELARMHVHLPAYGLGRGFPDV